MKFISLFKLALMYGRVVKPTIKPRPGQRGKAVS